MRLEKKKDEELARRAGLTKRTLVQLLFLTIVTVAAYFLTNALFAEELISRGRMLGVFPFLRRLPDWAPQVLIIIGLVFVMQILFTFFFFLFSPEAWRKIDQGSLYSQNKDPYDDYRQ
jgi:hypothetical protein